MTSISITSPQNTIYRELLECLTSKGVKKHGQFIISGTRVVRETLQRFPHLSRSLIGVPGVLDATLTHFALSKTDTNPKRFSILELAPELFKELDVFGTHSPLLVVTTPQVNDCNLSIEPKGLEIFCGLSEPSNVGALMRSAAAFGASKIILLKESASPFHPKAVRAASGTTLVLPIERGPSIHDFKSSGVVALDMKGTPIQKFQWPQNLRLLMGEEGRGVPKSAAGREGQQFISIDMLNGVESLNATVAASVALYSYRAQHPLIKQI